MNKKHDKTTRDARRLDLRKEILRNLSTDDLTAAAGGLGTTHGGPCPRSKTCE